MYSLVERATANIDAQERELGQKAMVAHGVGQKADVDAARACNATNSILAGFFGALASVFGKFAFSNDSILVAFVEQSCLQTTLLPSHGTGVCAYVVYAFRALMFLIMGWVNAMMFHYAFKAMNTEGSLSGTVTTTSCNFLFTALLGYFLFQEDLSPMWFGGAACIAVGIYLVTRGKASADAGTKEKKD